MDLVPKPSQVAAAAGNVAHRVLRGGLADLRPMPRTLIDDGPLREVYHYRPHADGPESGDPVLLVAPLAAPSLCYDLRRGCSLVEHLLADGRPTYLVEYGEVSLRDRGLGLERWVEEVLPAAIHAAFQHAGGRPVHLVGWSLGGLFSLLTLAARPGGALPVASLSMLGTPVDVARVPLTAPFRPLLTAEDLPAPVTRTYRLLGGAPDPLVGWAAGLPPVDRLVTRPLALAAHADDREWLAQVEAVQRFTAAMTAYPGRAYGQLYHRFATGNQLAGGTLELGGRTVALADIDVPVLVVAGAHDTIAPLEAVRAVVPMLSGSPEAQLEVVPGGHLGLLTGRGARDSTWPALDEWLYRWSPPGDHPTLGTDPHRRHSSASSRTFGR
ncbi:alpha/beta hydrolase [Nocardioides sp. YIM 152588]|uniref:alpha/beta hydrolase n=1 Tax=Nocardioides sp. YIM 152588 TaxID=3158259 RepID=UPI0032E4DE51